MSPRILYGYELRSWLAVELHDNPGPMSVRELVDRLHERGYGVNGRASKVISDTLRWHVRRTRVRRLGWGTYTEGRIARTTLWRMRKCLRAVLNDRSPVHANALEFLLWEAKVAGTRNTTTVDGLAFDPTRQNDPSCDGHGNPWSLTASWKPPD